MLDGDCPAEDDAYRVQGKLGHQQLIAGHTSQKFSNLAGAFLIEEALKPDICVHEMH
jgi:hypothetical protein